MQVVNGFPDYAVDQNGGVWTCKPPNGRGPAVKRRPLRPWANGRGYLCVTLLGDGRRICARVHRLVLAAFVGPCPGGMQGLHRDDDRSNNNLKNLYYGTRKNNAADALANGRQPQGESHGRHKLTAAEVVEIRRRCQEGEPQKRIAVEFSVSLSTIKQIRARTHWQSLKEECHGETSPKKAGKAGIS